MNLYPKPIAAAVLFALAEQKLGPACRKFLRLTVGRCGALEIAVV